MLSKKKSIVVAVLLTALVATMVFAAIRYTAIIDNTANVKGYKIALWNTLTNQPIDAIPWGDLDLNIPKDTDMVFTTVHQIRVKNVGSYACFVAWKMNDTLPSGVTLSCEYRVGDSEGTWKPYPQNEYSLISQISIGAYSDAAVRWTLLAGSGATMGSFDFKIYLLAADSMGG